MKDTPETKDKLRGLINSGAQAESLLKKLDPLFVELRERNRASLVNAVKLESMEAVYQEACQTAALENLYQLIYSKAVTGARAQKAADELEAAK